jgi:hypothetical protein
MALLPATAPLGPSITGKAVDANPGAARRSVTTCGPGASTTQGSGCRTAWLAQTARSQKCEPAKTSSCRCAVCSVVFVFT